MNSSVSQRENANTGVTCAQTLCLLCQGEIYPTLTGLYDTRFGIPNAYGVGRCGACGMEQLVPRPSAGDLKNLYESYYNFRGSNIRAYNSLRQRFLFSWLYRLWQMADGDMSFHFRPGRGRLLDVGCNEGRGLHFYSRSGFEAEGLELNEHAAETARALGFTVTTEALELFEPAQLYSTAVLANVLEHALDPIDSLRHVHRLLEPHGEVWVSCPNSESWLRRWFGGAWINWHIPFHISHFSKKTLRNALETAGFEIVQLKMETPGLWVSGSVLVSLFARPGRPTPALRSAAMVGTTTVAARVLFFPLWWLANRMGGGDMLYAVARRKEAPMAATPNAGHAKGPLL